LTAIKHNYVINDHVVENSGGVHLWVDTTRPKTGGVRTPWTPMDRRLCMVPIVGVKLGYGNVCFYEQCYCC